MLFTFSANALFSQEKATFSGKITDSLSGDALESVQIGIFGAKNPLGAYTNKYGSFSVQVPAGIPLEIRFSILNYETKTLTLTFSANEKKNLNILLSQKIKELQGVNIVDEASREKGITHISPTKLSDLVGPNESVESLIKTLPGVVSQNELSSQYSVRGGSFDENLVYINDIEIYRPFLVRAAEQEGLSVINPDMVERIDFSSGGFDATYGDKMSSVLDIAYRKPEKFGGKVSGSLLGFSAYVEGLIKEKFSFNLGFRRRSNEYILNSLPTKGNYKPVFTDFQGYLTYKISEKSDISFLGIYSRNKYKMIPETSTTDFGNYLQQMRLTVYFDGQEIDDYETMIGALTYAYRPTDKTLLKFILSAYQTRENELYDIEGQYFLYQLEEGSSTGQKTEYEKGVGSYFNHARNYLNANVISIEHKGLQSTDNGNWRWGFKYQHEYINDKISEWTMVDSAGYTIPNDAAGFIPGENNDPVPPELQDVIKAKNIVSSNRISGFAQKNWTWEMADTSSMGLIAGIRFQYWDFNNQFLPSPRASYYFKPHWRKDFLFRFATGVYSQSPFYREYRDNQGVIHDDIRAQNSYHFVGSSDFNFRMWSRPFKLTTELYYKYITNLIPYEIDNMRIRYAAENSGRGYATGIDVRLNGEFVEGIESWASMTIMQTQEDIDGDGKGYLPRPTDQRFMFKLFFQDYIPGLPWIKMSLNFTYGTGLPFTQPQTKAIGRLPDYMRVDWGTSFRLKGKNAKWAQNNFFKYLQEVWLYFDIYNLFQNKNVASYIWVSDYDNRYYAVPNYLTPFQLNVRLTIDF